MNIILKNCINFFSSVILCYFTTEQTDMLNWKVENPLSAWSSFAYSLIGAPLNIQIPCNILTVTSFNLWANSYDIINFIDVTCIFWVTLITFFHIIPYIKIKKRKKIITIFNFLVCLFMIFAFLLHKYKGILYFYSINLTKIFSALILSTTIIVSPKYYTESNFKKSCITLFSGSIIKYLGRNNYIELDFSTGIFHLLTALSIYYFLKL